MRILAPDGNNQAGSTIGGDGDERLRPIAPLPLVPKTIDLTSTSRMVISR